MTILSTAPVLFLLCALFQHQGAKQDLEVFRNLSRGKALPVITVQDLGGKKVQLDLKGATPCILAFLRQDQEDSKSVLAMLQRLALDPKAPRLRILVIGRKGSSTKDWIVVAKTLSHRISLYVDEFGSAKSVGTVVMPSLAILDAQGKLAGSFLLYEESLEKQIRALVNHILGRKGTLPGPAEAKRLRIAELDSNASGLQARRRYQEALALRRQQAELAGEDARILASIGYLQSKLGQTASAIKTLRKSLALQDAVVVRVHLGQALFEQSSYAAAKKELEEALPLSPDKALVHYTLALIARQKGKLDQALAHIKQALNRVHLARKTKDLPAKKSQGEEEDDGDQ